MTQPIDTSRIDADSAKAISLGLIKGRHPLPVDLYLLPENITVDVGFYNTLYNEAYMRAYKFGRSHTGELMGLYITGLTVAAMGAVDGLRAAGVCVLVRSWSPIDSTYHDVLPDLQPPGPRPELDRILEQIPDPIV